MTWLLHNYFLPTLNPSAVPSSQQNSVRPIAPLLKQYKTLLKLTVRDASLATRNKSAIAGLIREIERWISGAKVTANFAAGDFDWKAGKLSDDVDTNDQYRERWALEKLCDGLLEKGALVPLSKK
jgi:ribosomal biogenesis protein LAS1